MRPSAQGGGRLWPHHVEAAEPRHGGPGRLTALAGCGLVRAFCGFSCFF